MIQAPARDNVKMIRGAYEHFPGWPEAQTHPGIEMEFAQLFTIADDRQRGMEVYSDPEALAAAGIGG